MRIFINRRRLAATLALAAGLVACSDVKDTLLEASDPDLIDPSAVQSAAGANAVRLGALSRLRQSTANSESTWLFGGLLADEWSTSSTFVQNDETDQRNIKSDNSSVTGMLRTLYRARTGAMQAIELLNKYRPTPASDIAEMYFVKGFAELQLASDFCNGIPLSNGSGDVIEYGDPLPVKDVFAAAIASLDSAMALSNGTDAASVAVNRAARIAKARALLGIGLDKAAEAATLVSGIPTTYRYDVTASLTGGNNTLWDQPASQRRYTVGDSLEGNSRALLVKNAIPFFSARDPRLRVVYTVSANGKDTTKSQDGLTFSRTAPDIYGQTSSAAVVSGIDARFIEAEAAMKAGKPADMMTILNTLRATPIVLTAPSPTASGTHAGFTSPVMPALADPGNDADRISLMFREKAFWTFTRGQRLGDLRRLIRQYGRPQDQVFPTGTHYRGGVYGTDVNLPVTTPEQVGNPKFAQCLDRNA